MVQQIVTIEAIRLGVIELNVFIVGVVAPKKINFFENEISLVFMKTFKIL
jgi:hypothetical protein